LRSGSDGETRRWHQHRSLTAPARSTPVASRMSEWREHRQALSPGLPATRLPAGRDRRAQHAVPLRRKCNTFAGDPLIEQLVRVGRRALEAISRLTRPGKKTCPSAQACTFGERVVADRSRCSLPHRLPSRLRRQSPVPKPEHNVGSLGLARTACSQAKSPPGKRPARHKLPIGAPQRHQDGFLAAWVGAAKIMPMLRRWRPPGTATTSLRRHSCWRAWPSSFRQPEIRCTRATLSRKMRWAIRWGMKRRCSSLAPLRKSFQEW
jgi:hypothetical protein